MATLACYLAGLCQHSDALVPGERGVLLCVALDQRVAKIILDYAEACFERAPILKQLIASRTADALELTNGITLEVRPASFRKLRSCGRGRGAQLLAHFEELLHPHIVNRILGGLGLPAKSTP
jgi:hypothetical protein